MPMSKAANRLRSAIAALLGGAVSGIAPLAVAQSPNDDVAWQTARSLGSLEAFEQYLATYPNGAHAGAAFRCVVELSVDLPRSPCRIEPAAGATTDATVAGGMFVDIY
jgi:hypothetical protein